MGSVSFGSTYKINSGSDFRSQSKVVDFCMDNNIDYGIKHERTKQYDGRRVKNSLNLSTTIDAPDKKDKMIEAFLANQGIKFKKINPKETMNPEKMLSRLKDAPENMEIAFVSPEKLKKVIVNQDSNIPHCKSDYQKYYRPDINSAIKGGDEIPATSLVIVSLNELPDEMVDYIDTFGADNLNKGQLSVFFNQSRGSLPNQCMYFGMEDLGMDKIPVYVDEDTHKIGEALGLFAHEEK